ncbi:thiamine-phosphate kinase [Streptohalobacillus salinus]|uniref:Thiamine-monophosphate kinase n=1 Tax=Streptohalobacillus salinus TaxID=621096 RepID=A0A2V3VZM9_9BACI|nr:thiamine-phosphate kinase [Streptohalobacillus salinus]PXW86394.1 thiamine-phosphate kinase [Streptohalobacillus salinus]
MDEFKFIDSIKQSYYRQSSVIKGIGDDCAVIREGYHDIITAVDTMVDEVHFSRETMSTYDIGYRVLAANISDIAAMGAWPTSYMISIVIPDEYTDEELQSIYQGMDDLARGYDMDLIGGDTVTGKQLVISVTIHGIVPKGKARYRSAMEAGDILFVTGTLGDSSAGLDLLLGRIEASDGVDYLTARHRQPTPRVHFSHQLTHLDRLALNDVSDGISSEAHELAQASNKTVYIDDEQVPINPYLKQFCLEKQTYYKYSGGEDFELIGSVAPQHMRELKNIANQQGLLLTIIGEIKDQPNTNGNVFLRKSGIITPLEKRGYTHKNEG